MKDSDIRFSLVTASEVSTELLAQFPTLNDFLNVPDPLSRMLIQAEKDNRCVGIALLAYPNRMNALMVEDAKLELLEVDKSARLQGVGKAILNAMEAYAATISTKLSIDCALLIGRRPMQSLLSSTGYLAPFSNVSEKQTEWVKHLTLSRHP